MTQNSTVKDAADRLQRALKTLENSLGPMIDKVATLERQSLDAQSFKEDRARLAAQLDEATLREKSFKEREVEFSKLADETTRTLDSVISQVVHALGEGG